MAIRAVGFVVNFPNSPPPPSYEVRRRKLPVPLNPPVGALGMTERELAEYVRTGKWPDRQLTTAPDIPPGLSLTEPRLEGNAAHGAAPFEGLGAAIRDYWRLDGKLEGRREAREEAIEALRRAEKLAERGRPSFFTNDVAEMIAIIRDNPGREGDETFCRRLFKASLPYSETSAESDQKRWPNQRSKRAWEAAQHILLGGREK